MRGTLCGWFVSLVAAARFVDVISTIYVFVVIFIDCQVLFAGIRCFPDICTPSRYYHGTQNR